MMIFGTVKKFFKENGWEKIKKFCSGVTVVLTLILLWQANILVKFNNEIYKKELYPHFRVLESIENRNEDGVFADEVIRIRNYGGNYYSFISHVQTYISLTMDGKKYLMPCSGYYSIHRSYSSGDIVREHFYKDNNLKISNIIKEVNRILWDEKFIGSYGPTITYVKIEYQDIFGGMETLYFEAGSSVKLDNKTGKKYFEDFSSFYNFNGNWYSFDMDEMTVDLLYEFATTGLKEAFLVKK